MRVALLTVMRETKEGEWEDMGLLVVTSQALVRRDGSRIDDYLSTVF